MISTGVIRKLDSVGRISIPIGARRQLHFDENDEFEIFIDYDTNAIVLVKPQTDKNKITTFADKIKELFNKYNIDTSDLEQMIDEKVSLIS